MITTQQFRAYVKSRTFAPKCEIPTPKPGLLDRKDPKSRIFAFSRIRDLTRTWHSIALFLLLLTSFLFLALLFQAQPSYAGLNDGLVAYYPFNGNANDESENGHNAIVNGAVLVSDRFGNPQSAYGFNGITDYLYIASNIPFKSPDWNTIAFWINFPNGFGTGSDIHGQVVLKKFKSSRENIIVDFNTSPTYYGSLSFYADGGAPIKTNPKTWDPNRWYHVAIVYNDHSTRFYINGQLDNTIGLGYGCNGCPINCGDPPIPTYIGFSPIEHNYFNGLLDDFRIYNRALSEAEIQELYGGFAQPTIAQSPPSGPPGTPFVEWGTGFTPNSTATLHFKKPDGTEYPTKDQPIDNIGHFEITYTAPWNKPPGTYTWWAIDDTIGKKSNEIPYVIEGTSGQAVGLSVTLDGTQPFPNQNVNALFPINIQALDYAGSVASGFSGQIFLTPSGPGFVIPYQVPITNGSGSYNVRITEPSQATHIHAQCNGIYGDSNDFAVLSGVQTFGSVKGYVYDSNQGPAKGATVNLSDSGSDTVKYTALSGASGSFFLSQIPSGSYQLWAVYGNRQSQKYPLLVSGGKLTQLDRVMIRSKKRPVILVAGIMGSTTKDWFQAHALYPTLPKESPADQDDLRFWNLGDYAGWDTLKKELKDHYEYYDCPYDWRQPLDKPDVTYRKYLMRLIKRAIDETGWPKVDVVAHSMGGLLVRSYIQSEDFRHDIDKFAMVGTPNHGSLKAYYLWEGGDPKLLDEKTGSLFPYYLYSNVCNNIYKEQHGGHSMFFYCDDLPLDICSVAGVPIKGLPIQMRISKEEARSYFFDSVRAINQLMPTFDNCLNGSNSKIEASKNQNNWLIKLNNDSNIDRIKQGGEVTSRNFYAMHENTISQITVKPSTMENLYEDGEPKGNPKKEDAGDTTVLWESADIPDVYPVPNWTGEHGKLIGVFATDIRNFLDQDRTFATVARANAVEAVASPATVLGLSFRGPAAALITGTRSFECGIDDNTQKSYDKPGTCDIVRDPSGGGFSMTNPREGIYTVTLTGKSVGEVFLDLTYVGDNSTYEQKLSFFYPGKSTSFTLVFDPTADTPIKIQGRPSKPRNVIAFSEAIGGMEKAKLTWAPVADSGIRGYNVYTRKDGEPFLTKLKTVSSWATECSTGFPWESPVRVFAVSAVNRAGKEGFLSSFVTNETVTVANFSASPQEGAAPLEATFSDASVGSPTSWLWDFGDNQTSTETNPVHTYQNPGTYTVSLTIVGPNGSDLGTKSDYIKVE